VIPFLQVQTLLQEYEIVCINRDGKDARRLVFEHEILYNNRVSTLGDYYCLHFVALVFLWLEMRSGSSELVLRYVPGRESIIWSREFEGPWTDVTESD